MSYVAGDPWFICDRCSQKWRRSQMCREWDGLVVCPPCCDPRPPEMTPPNVYPEGLAVRDPRPPQDDAQLGANGEATNYLTYTVTRDML